jgi:hypothetical protein
LIPYNNPRQQNLLSETSAVLVQGTFRRSW